MFLSAPLFTLLAASAAVLASPFPEPEQIRPRALKNCKDWMYGSIVANATGKYIPFVLNKDLELSWNGDQHDYSLKVMYQVRLPIAREKV